MFLRISPSTLGSSVSLQSRCFSNTGGDSLRTDHSLPSTIFCTRLCIQLSWFFKYHKKPFTNVHSSIQHHKNPDFSFYVPKDSKTCKYLFVRKINKRGIQRPYEGRYHILEKRPTYFIQKSKRYNNHVSLTTLS